MRSRFTLLGITLGLLQAPLALAIVLPNAPCATQQFGCGGGPSNIIYSALIGPNGIAVELLKLTTAIAVLFIVWSGVQMIISSGDEGKITKHKWGIAYALIGFSVSVLSQFVISAVGTQDYVSGGQDLPLNIIGNAAVILRVVLNGLFVVMLVVAGLRLVYAQGKSDDYNTAKKMLYWGIAGAVLVNLAAALVYAVADYFGVLS